MDNSISNYKLTPSITLKEIYGPNHVLNPRPSFAEYGWLNNKQSVLDCFTGTPLAIANDLPVVCSHSVSTKESFQLFQWANIDKPSSLYIYDSAAQYQNILDTLVQDDKKLIINHVHPPDEIPTSAYWINPQLLSFLNNKANLDKIVSTNYVPRRSTIHPSEISISHDFHYPLVVKVGTDQPTGGGYDVKICLKEEEFLAGIKKFSKSESIVIEEFVRIKRNYCVQFAKSITGEIHYLGAAEQITSSSGIYMGNWIEKDFKPPEKMIVLGREIMENACSMGFRGIAGFDIVETDDNRVLAIDLNFRLNGSTPALLLQQSIFKHVGASTLLFRSWVTKAPFANVMKTSRIAIKKGFLIPLYIYKSNTYSFTRLSGILVGSSRKMIRQRIYPRFSRRIKRI